MSNLYLHIGVARTGTTFLQTVLYSNRHLLAKRGFVFPILPAGTESVLTGIELFRGNRKYTNILLDRVKRYPEHDIIISNEMLYKNLISAKDLHLVKYVLEELGRDIKIICYLRRQDECVISGYPIDVSRGSRMPLAFDAGRQAQHFDYYRNIKRWRQVFGPENVIIRRFGRDYFSGGRLEQDFAEQIGLDITDFEFKANANKSFNADAVEVVRLMNEKMTQLPFDTMSFLRQEIFPLGEPKGVGASRADRLAFLEHFNKSNDLVAKEFLGLDGPLFEHDVPDNGTTLTNDSVLPIMFDLLTRLPINVPEDPRRLYSKNLYYLAKQHLAAAEYGEARSLFEEMIGQHGAEGYRLLSELHWRLAGCTMKLGDKVEALRILGNVLEDTDVEKSVLVNCAKLAQACGDDALAGQFRDLVAAQQK